MDKFNNSIKLHNITEGLVYRKYRRVSVSAYALNSLEVHSAGVVHGDLTGVGHLIDIFHILMAFIRPTC